MVRVASSFSLRKYTDLSRYSLIIIHYKKARSTRWLYFYQALFVIIVAVLIHYLKYWVYYYYQQTEIDLASDRSDKFNCKHIPYESYIIRQKFAEIEAKIDALNDKLERWHSDQIGVFDYAAEYAGGSIISTPETTSYPVNSGLRLFSVIEWMPESKPEIILQQTQYPGQCYAFYGSKGRIRVKLGRPIVITHVSLEHIRIGDNVDSALKNFQVLGLSEKSRGESLGNFTYKLEDGIIQTFKTRLRKKYYNEIELRIFDNHGNEDFTCVYRFRAHSLPEI